MCHIPPIFVAHLSQWWKHVLIGRLPFESYLAGPKCQGQRIKMIYSSVAMALSESGISQWRVKYACSKIPVHLAGWFLMQIFLRVPPLWPTSRVWLYLPVLHLKVLHFLLHAATSHFLNDEEIKCTCRCCCQQGLSLTLTPAQDLNQPTNVQITVKLHHFPLVSEKV